MLISSWRSRRSGGWISSGLHGNLVRQGGMFLLALVLLCVACAQPPQVSDQTRLRFLDDGLELSLAQACDGCSLEVRDAQQLPLQTLSLAGQDPRQRLRFDWPDDRSLTFLLRDPAGNLLQTLHQHSPSRPPIVATLRLPYGQQATPLLPDGQGQLLQVAAPPGGKLQLGLEVAARRTPLTARWELKADPALRLTCPPTPPMTLQPEALPQAVLCTLELPTAPRAAALEVRLHYRPRVSPSPTPAQGGAVPASPAGSHPPPTGQNGNVTATTGPQRPADVTLLARAQLLVTDPAALRERLLFTGLELPTTADGRLERGQPPDGLFLPDPLWQRLASLLGLSPMSFDAYAPRAFQALDFRNQGPLPVTLLLTANVLDPETRAPAAPFRPRAFEVTGGTGQVTSLVQVPARGEARAVLPLYAERDTPAGTWLNQVEVRVLGASDPIYRVERPLTVSQGSSRVTLVLFLVLPLALGWVWWLMRQYDRLLARLDARGLVTIALFGAVLFSVGFLVDLLSLGLTMLLGPFNIFLGGMLYEAMHHLVLVSLVLLYPRPGTASLLGLTHFLLRALTTGQLSPLDVVFVGSSMALKELSLYVWGVTRGADFNTRFLHGPRGATLRMGLALSLAAMATALASLSLHTAFYRLFFADWYVLATVLVGLVGPWPGILAGLRLGRDLDRVRD